MDRNFYFISTYLNILMDDIYPQPEDDGHRAWAKEVLDKWFTKLDPDTSILDVGAGVGMLQPLLEEMGMKNYLGVSIGKDVAEARKLERNVHNYDFHFLPYDDLSFDLIVSRHSLEHSPMPLLALFEWYRVSKYWLCLILPNPEFWGRTGLNHYSVLDKEQAVFLLQRARWNPIWSDITEKEIRLFCEKA